MTETRLAIPHHLAEYLMHKYDIRNGILFIDHHSDLYFLVWNLLSKRPVNAPMDSGILRIHIPKRRLGKNPDVYNYLSRKSITIITRYINRMFKAEVHEYLDYHRHQNPTVPTKEAVYAFMEEYGIESISASALIKDYYRWRKSRFTIKNGKKIYPLNYLNCPHP